MKTLLLLVGLIALASATLAEEYGSYGGAMGVFFSDSEFTEATMNLDTPPGVFDCYVVLLDAQVTNMGGYECGLAFSDPGMSILDASGPSGWMNYGGGVDNHRVGYIYPLPVPADGSVVLCTLQGLYTGSGQVDFVMGPSTPSSGDPDQNPYQLSWNGPIIADYYVPDTLLFCDLTSGASDVPGAVAWLNRRAVAVETRSWTGVKDLFD